MDSQKPAPPPEPTPIPETPRNEVMTVLQQILDTVAASLTYQEKMVDNLVYTRERVDKLHDRVKAIAERVATLETGVGAPAATKEEIAEAMVGSMDYVVTAVNSMKDEVRKTMQLAMNGKNSDRMAKIQESLNRIANEFGALERLTVETLSEAPR